MQTAIAPDQQNNGEKSSACGVSRADMMSAPVTVHVSVGKSETPREPVRDPARDWAPLYWLRKRAGFTIRELAALSGVTPWQIQGYEACLTEPRVGQAFRLALALGVSVDRLFGIPYKKRAREDADR